LNYNTIKSLINNQFPYHPTEGQTKLISHLAEFLIGFRERKIFVLKGYAGTGKTTLVSSLVNVLPSVKIRSVLLAPTGRAAKVLASYSGKQAFTIHKKIYLARARSDGSISLVLQENLHKNTLFIVDEASMIQNESYSSDFSFFSARNLLDDLVNYVDQGQNCRLMLIGDTAQLPPVGLDLSPALNTEYLKSRYTISLIVFELVEVVRQSRKSGILHQATLLRDKIAADNADGKLFSLSEKPDVHRISGNDLEDSLNTAISDDGIEESVIICRSNKRANIFNQEIRNRILFRDSEISAGDMMMVVKNNYFWLPKDSFAGFIANGDIIEILRINGYEELYGFRYADVIVRLLDYPQEKEIETKVLLDTIHSESPSLNQDDNNRLFNTIMEDYAEIPNRRSKVEKVKNSPFFNALQVKFAYSLTCHKTQGGQWRNVFIDQGYLKEEMINKEYLRWLYTAVTRATRNLYLVNFNERFFGSNENLNI